MKTHNLSWTYHIFPCAENYLQGEVEKSRLEVTFFIQKKGIK